MCESVETRLVELGCFFSLFHTVDTDAVCFQYWNCVNSGGLHLCSTVGWKISVWIHFLLLLKELDFLLHITPLWWLFGSLVWLYDAASPNGVLRVKSRRKNERKKKEREKKKGRKTVWQICSCQSKHTWRSSIQHYPFPPQTHLFTKRESVKSGPLLVDLYGEKMLQHPPGDSRTDNILSIKM